MNKNDFYRQLLEQYAINQDKIKQNAIKTARKRAVTSTVLKIVPFASAAAILLTIGVANYNNWLPSGIDLTSKTNVESAVQRLVDAETAYLEANDISSRNEDQSFYVSFETGMTYNEMMLAFSTVSDTGDISIDVLYSDSATLAKGSDIEKYVKNHPEQLIYGVKITAPGMLMLSIKDLSVVSLLELDSKIDDEDLFTPITSSIKQDISSEASYDSNTSFDITLPSNIGDVPTIGDSSLNTTEEVTTSDTNYDEEVTDDETDNSEQNTDTSDDSVIDGSSSATDLTTSDTITSIETTPDNNELEPDLPVAIEDIIIPTESVIEATFINNNTLLMLENGAISIYSISDAGVADVLTKFYAENPKISWINADGTQAFITACNADKKRTKLYYADGVSGTLTEIDVSIITDDSELTGIYYSSTDDVLVFKTVSFSDTKLYYAKKNGSGFTVTPAIMYNLPVTAVSYCNGKLYYAVCNSDVTTIYSHNTITGENVQLYYFNGQVKISQSFRFDGCAFIQGTDSPSTVIFNAKDETFSYIGNISPISFSSKNSSIFTDDEKYYCLAASGLIEISAEDARIYYSEPLGSDFYSVVINAQEVIISSK